MLLDTKSFFDNIVSSYETLPSEAKLIVYIILILLFIVLILLITMMEQRRLNKKIVNSNQTEEKDNTEILNFDFGESDSIGIDEANEKTRNLKEITDKIQAVIDNKAIDLTKFEQDQEENSIISYNELMKSVDSQTSEVKQQDFSLPNLVRKIEVDEEIENQEPFVVTPIKEEKFKSSVFISPIFGIQDSSRTVIKDELIISKQEEVSPVNTYTEEETFLTNLKDFRKKLD